MEKKIEWKLGSDGFFRREEVVIDKLQQLIDFGGRFKRRPSWLVSEIKFEMKKGAGK
jgi:hypothetical protein